MSDDPTSEDPTEGEPPAPPSRPRWKRRLAIVLAPLLVLGVAGTGIAVAIDQHDAKVRKQRTAAYVAAVTPLAYRVYDAVQPLQNSMDAWAHLRPGLWEASRDVVLKSGAREELVAVRAALLARKPPASRAAAARHLADAAQALADAVKGLEDSVRNAEESTLCTVCLAQDTLGVAETSWSDALDELGTSQKLSEPAINDEGRRGRTTATRGGFIFQADLACAAGQEALDLLPDQTDAEAMKNMPAAAKILRRTIGALRAIKSPTSNQTFQHRLDVELQSATAVADTMDRLAAAYRRRDKQAFTAALSRWNLELRAMNEVKSTYAERGVSQCEDFFDASDVGAGNSSLGA